VRRHEKKQNLENGGKEVGKNGGKRQYLLIPQKKMNAEGGKSVGGGEGKGNDFEGRR